MNIPNIANQLAQIRFQLESLAFTVSMLERAANADASEEPEAPKRAPGQAYFTKAQRLQAGRFALWHRSHNTPWPHIAAMLRCSESSAHALAASARKASADTPLSVNRGQKRTPERQAEFRAEVLRMTAQGIPQSDIAATFGASPAKVREIQLEVRPKRAEKARAHTRTPPPDAPPAPPDPPALAPNPPVLAPNPPAPAPTIAPLGSLREAAQELAHMGCADPAAWIAARLNISPREARDAIARDDKPKGVDKLLKAIAVEAARRKGAI